MRKVNMLANLCQEGKVFKKETTGVFFFMKNDLTARKILFLVIKNHDDK